MGDEEGDDGVEAGKIPDYPREMLKMEISDGRRVMKAMEYRRIGALKLGETALGAKVGFGWGRLGLTSSCW